MDQASKSPHGKTFDLKDEHKSLLSLPCSHSIPLNPSLENTDPFVNNTPHSSLHPANTHIDPHTNSIVPIYQIPVKSDPVSSPPRSFDQYTQLFNHNRHNGEFFWKSTQQHSSSITATTHAMITLTELSIINPYFKTKNSESDHSDKLDEPAPNKLPITQDIHDSFLLHPTTTAVHGATILLSDNPALSSVLADIINNPSLTQLDRMHTESPSNTPHTDPKYTSSQGKNTRGANQASKLDERSFMSRITYNGLHYFDFFSPELISFSPTLYNEQHHGHFVQPQRIISLITPASINQSPLLLNYSEQSPTTQILSPQTNINLATDRDQDQVGDNSSFPSISHAISSGTLFGEISYRMKLLWDGFDRPDSIQPQTTFQPSTSSKTHCSDLKHRQSATTMYGVNNHEGLMTYLFSLIDELGLTDFLHLNLSTIIASLSHPTSSPDPFTTLSTNDIVNLITDTDSHDEIHRDEYFNHYHLRQGYFSSKTHIYLNTMPMSTFLNTYQLVLSEKQQANFHFTNQTNSDPKDQQSHTEHSHEIGNDSQVISNVESVNTPSRVMGLGPIATQNEFPANLAQTAWFSTNQGLTSLNSTAVTTVGEFFIILSILYHLLTKPTYIIIDSVLNHLNHTLQHRVIAFLTQQYQNIAQLTISPLFLFVSCDSLTDQTLALIDNVWLIKGQRQLYYGPLMSTNAPIVIKEWQNRGHLVDKVIQKQSKKSVRVDYNDKHTLSRDTVNLLKTAVNPTAIDLDFKKWLTQGDLNAFLSSVNFHIPQSDAFFPHVCRFVTSQHTSSFFQAISRDLAQSDCMKFADQHHIQYNEITTLNPALQPTTSTTNPINQDISHNDELESFITTFGLLNNISCSIRHLGKQTLDSLSSNHFSYQSMCYFIAQHYQQSILCDYNRDLHDTNFPLFSQIDTSYNDNEDVLSDAFHKRSDTVNATNKLKTVSATKLDQKGLKDETIVKKLSKGGSKGHIPRQYGDAAVDDAIYNGVLQHGEGGADGNKLKLIKRDRFATVPFNLDFYSTFHLPTGNRIKATMLYSLVSHHFSPFYTGFTNLLSTLFCYNKPRHRHLNSPTIETKTALNETASMPNALSSLQPQSPSPVPLSSLTSPQPESYTTSLYSIFTGIALLLALSYFNLSPSQAFAKSSLIFSTLLLITFLKITLFTLVPTVSTLISNTLSPTIAPTLHPLISSSYFLALPSNTPSSQSSLIQTMLIYSFITSLFQSLLISTPIYFISHFTLSAPAFFTSLAHILAYSLFIDITLPILHLLLANPLSWTTLSPKRSLHQQLSKLVSPMFLSTITFYSLFLLASSHFLPLNLSNYPLHLLLPSFWTQQALQWTEMYFNPALSATFLNTTLASLFRAELYIQYSHPLWVIASSLYILTSILTSYAFFAFLLYRFRLNSKSTGSHLISYKLAQSQYVQEKYITIGVDSNNGVGFASWRIKQEKQTHKNKENKRKTTNEAVSVDKSSDIRHSSTFYDFSSVYRVCTRQPMCPSAFSDRNSIDPFFSFDNDCSRTKRISPVIDIGDSTPPEFTYLQYRASYVDIFAQNDRKAETSALSNASDTSSPDMTVINNNASNFPHSSAIANKALNLAPILNHITFDVLPFHLHVITIPTPSINHSTQHPRQQFTQLFNQLHNSLQLASFHTILRSHQTDSNPISPRSNNTHSLYPYQSPSTPSNHVLTTQSSPQNYHSNYHRTSPTGVDRHHKDTIHHAEHNQAQNSPLHSNTPQTTSITANSPNHTHLASNLSMGSLTISQTQTHSGSNYSNSTLHDQTLSPFQQRTANTPSFQRNVDKSTQIPAISDHSSLSHHSITSTLSSTSTLSDIDNVAYNRTPINVYTPTHITVTPQLVECFFLNESFANFTLLDVFQLLFKSSPIFVTSHGAIQTKSHVLHQFTSKPGKSLKSADIHVNKRSPSKVKSAKGRKGVNSEELQAQLLSAEIPPEMLKDRDQRNFHLQHSLDDFLYHSGAPRALYLMKNEYEELQKCFYSTLFTLLTTLDLDKYFLTTFQSDEPTINNVDLRSSANLTWNLNHIPGDKKIVLFLVYSIMSQFLANVISIQTNPYYRMIVYQQTEDVVPSLVAFSITNETLSVFTPSPNAALALLQSLNTILHTSYLPTYNKFAPTASLTAFKVQIDNFVSQYADVDMQAPIGEQNGGLSTGHQQHSEDISTTLPHAFCDSIIVGLTHSSISYELLSQIDSISILHPEILNKQLKSGDKLSSYAPPAAINLDRNVTHTKKPMFDQIDEEFSMSINPTSSLNDRFQWGENSTVKTDPIDSLDELDQKTDDFTESSKVLKSSPNSILLPFTLSEPNDTLDVKSFSPSARNMQEKLNMKSKKEAKSIVGSQSRELAQHPTPSHPYQVYLSSHNPFLYHGPINIRHCHNIYALAGSLMNSHTCPQNPIYSTSFAQLLSSSKFYDEINQSIRLRRAPSKSKASIQTPQTWSFYSHNRPSTSPFTPIPHPQLMNNVTQPAGTVLTNVNSDIPSSQSVDAPMLSKSKLTSMPNTSSLFSIYLSTFPFIMKSFFFSTISPHLMTFFFPIFIALLLMSTISMSIPTITSTQFLSRYFITFVTTHLIPVLISTTILFPSLSKVIYATSTKSTILSTLLTSIAPFLTITLPLAIPPMIILTASLPQAESIREPHPMQHLLLFVSFLLQLITLTFFYLFAVFSSLSCLILSHIPVYWPNNASCAQPSPDERSSDLIEPSPADRSDLILHSQNHHPIPTTATGQPILTTHNSTALISPYLWFIATTFLIAVFSTGFITQDSEQTTIPYLFPIISFLFTPTPHFVITYLTFATIYKLPLPSSTAFTPASPPFASEILFVQSDLAKGRTMISLENFFTKALFRSFLPSSAVHCVFSLLWVAFTIIVVPYVLLKHANLFSRIKYLLNMAYFRCTARTFYLYRVQRTRTQLLDVSDRQKTQGQRNIEASSKQEATSAPVNITQSRNIAQNSGNSKCDLSTQKTSPQHNSGKHSPLPSQHRDPTVLIRKLRSGE